MKKGILSFLFVLYLLEGLAQGAIGIGTFTPDAHAILDIRSTTKGILIPRVTTAQRNAIDVGSTNGMLVYDLNTISFWYYGDGDWQEIKSDANREWFKFQDSLLWSAKNIGIGNFSIDPSAALDIQSTTKGILIPRVTTAQRNAMNSYAVDGLLVFDADEVRFFYYTPGGWIGIGDFQQTLWFPTGNNTVSSAGAQNVGIGTQLSSRTPQYRLDVEGRVRVRQSAQGSAGLWLDSVSGANPNSFIGIINDSTTGIWGQAALNWGLAQNNRTLNVGLGTRTPQRSAILELNSTQKAFLPPKMTFAQILAIPSPQAGMVAYDIDGKTLRVYNGSKWVRTNKKDEPLQSSGVNSNATGNSYSGLSDNEGLRIAEDGAGNMYVAGVFNTSHAGLGLVANPGSGPKDIFLAKWNSAGNLLWSRAIGGEFNDTLTGMEISIDGNIYLTGQFSGSCNFGGNIITANNSNDGFLTKWDPSGNQVWTVSFGGSSSELPDMVEDLAVDNSGNLYVTGSFAGVFNTSVSGLNMTSFGSYDAFVIKISPSGTLQWMRRSGGSKTDYGLFVETDQAGNVFTYGIAGGSMSAGPFGIFVPRARNRRLRLVRIRRQRAIRQTLRSRVTFTQSPIRGYTRSSIVDYLVCYNALTGNETSLVRKSNIEEIKGTANGYYEVSRGSITRYNAASVQQSRITMNKSVQISRKGLYVAPNNDVVLLAYAEVGSAINFVPIAPDASGWLLMRISPTGNIVWTNQLQTSGSFYVNSIKGNSTGTTFYYTGDFSGSILLDNGTLVSGTKNMFAIRYQQ